MSSTRETEKRVLTLFYPLSPFEKARLSPFPQDLIDELDVVAGGRGLGHLAIRGAVVGITDWSPNTGGGVFKTIRW